MPRAPSPACHGHGEHRAMLGRARTCCHVDDVEATCARAVAVGGTVVDEPLDRRGACARPSSLISRRSAGRSPSTCATSALRPGTPRSSPRDLHAPAPIGAWLPDRRRDRRTSPASRSPHSLRPELQKGTPPFTTTPPESTTSFLLAGIRGLGSVAPRILLETRSGAWVQSRCSAVSDFSIAGQDLAAAHHHLPFPG